MEIITAIPKEKDGAMARSEAEEYMTRLIAERTLFMDENTDVTFGRFTHAFVLCLLNTKLALSQRPSRNSTCGRS